MDGAALVNLLQAIGNTGYGALRHCSDVEKAGELHIQGVRRYAIVVHYCEPPATQDMGLSGFFN
jgi:hypothetical protein